MKKYVSYVNIVLAYLKDYFARNSFYHFCNTRRNDDVYTPREKTQPREENVLDSQELPFSTDYQIH